MPFSPGPVVLDRPPWDGNWIESADNGSHLYVHVDGETRIYNTGLRATWEMLTAVEKNGDNGLLSLDGSRAVVSSRAGTKVHTLERNGAFVSQIDGEVLRFDAEGNRLP